jgi:SAM-dependent methyltransferase
MEGLEMSSTDAPAIYTDDSYWAAHSDFHDEGGPLKAAACLSLLKHHGVPVRTVLDVGCGGGGFLAALSAEISGEFLGIDVSELPVRRATERHAKPNVRFEERNTSEVAGTFDLVTLNDVFEHVDDYIGFLREMRRLGHAFYFNIPLDMTVLNVLRHTYMRERHKVGHLHYFSKRSALATLEYAGYAVVGWRYESSVDLGLKVKPTVWQWLAAMPRAVSFKLAPELSVHLLGGAFLAVLARPT